MTGSKHGRLSSRIRYLLLPTVTSCVAGSKHYPSITSVETTDSNCELIFAVFNATYDRVSSCAAYAQEMRSQTEL